MQKITMCLESMINWVLIVEFFDLNERSIFFWVTVRVS